MKFTNVFWASEGVPVQGRVHNQPSGSVPEIVGFLPSSCEDSVHPLPIGINVAEYLVQCVH